MPHINKQMVSFFLTTKCNLRCVYCYNSQERAKMQEQSLPLHIAKAGIDYFFSTNSSRHIRFYGPGEPTQEFSLLTQIVDYAKSKSNDVTTEIQTNGCFNKKVRQWLLENMNIIWVSFDGEPDIQNHNRPCANNKDSSPIIEENVRWLINHANPNQLTVGARVTITNETISRQISIINYLSSLGIQYIWNDPIFPSVGKIPVCQDKNKLEEYNFDMDSYADYYIDAFKYAQTKGIFYGSFLTCNFDGKCTQHCRACTPVPHFTTDGYISACDLVTFGKDAGHMDCFVYGKWNENRNQFEFDKQKIQILRNRSTDSIPHCIHCSAKNYCGGYCLGEITNETGNLFGQKNKTCQAIRKLFDELGELPQYDYLHP